MPFSSEKQRKFLHAQYPSLAKRWEDEAKAKGKPAVKRKSPKKKGKK